MNDKIRPPAPLNPDESLNAGLTAIPETHPDVELDAFEYGRASEADARLAGYTDENGHAVDKARPDKPGSPTGAYTDIGAGRSSVTRREPHSRH